MQAEAQGQVKLHASTFALAFSHGRATCVVYCISKCSSNVRRAAIHWDDADLPREVVMRPAGTAVPEWHWSGSFRLTTR